MTIELDQHRPLVFQGWPKIYRLNRTIYVTEKIDGTNAAIGILDDGKTIYAQSRTRLITPDDDNFGFARWVAENDTDLFESLGPGLHFGEWWGSGIQRNYGLASGDRRFSLFNAFKWSADREDEFRSEEAPLCHVVPIVGVRDGFDYANECVENLRERGSLARPGFMNPEGVVAFHKQAGYAFKVTLDGDAEHKGKQR